MRDIAARAGLLVELLQAAVQKAQEPLQARPFGWKSVGSRLKQDREHVGDRALLDHDRTVHVALAEFELGIEQDRNLGGGGGEANGYRFAGAVAEMHNGAARRGEL